MWYPESPDQSLFARSADQLRSGAVYFRDIWDLKQPGIYWFYALGDVIAPGGLGARILECLLVFGAAALVSWFVAGWGLRRSVRLAAPTLVLGPYLAYAGLSGMGEIEGLMNPLIVAVVACTWPRGRHRPPLDGGPGLRSKHAWFVAGLLVGAVCLLKAMYTPIPLVVLGGAAVLGLRVDRRGTLVRAAAAALGAALPVLAAVAYLASQGVLGVAVQTTFVIPFDVAAQPALRDGFLELPRALKNMFAVVGPLAVVGVLAARRQGRLAFAVTLLGTAAVAFALALPQLWTTYRWLMLSAPVGLVAIGGLEAALARVQRLPARPVRLGVRAVAALAVVVLSAFLLRPAFQAVDTGRGWGLSATSRITRAETADPLTHPVAAAELVSGEIPRGSRVYVLGDARIAALLDARPGAAMVGLTMQVMPAGVWDELTRELTLSRPPFIYVGARQELALAESPGRGVRRLLAADYRVLAASADGTWYRTDNPGEPLGPGYLPFEVSRTPGPG